MTELEQLKNTLCNEVMHRQQLGAQLTSAAQQMQELQGLIRKDMSDIRDAIHSRNFEAAHAILNRVIGPEVKNEVAPT